MKTYKQIIEGLGLNESRKVINIKVNFSKLNALMKKLPDPIFYTHGNIIKNLLKVDSGDRSFWAITGKDTHNVMDEIAYRLGVSDEKRIKDYHSATLENAADEKGAIKTMVAIGKELKSWTQVNDQYVRVGKKFVSVLWNDANARGPAES